jgi:hypothetical protein
MSLEMAHKVIVPQKKNYVPQFLKQRDINSYFKCALESHFTSISGQGGSILSKKKRCTLLCMLVQTYI